jgi:hypothetical protein
LLGLLAIDQSGLHHAPITQQDDQQFSLPPPPLTPNIAASNDDMRRDDEWVPGTANNNRARGPSLSGFTSVIEKATAISFSAATTEREFNLQKPALCSDATLREQFKERSLQSSFSGICYHANKLALHHDLPFRGKILPLHQHWGNK